MQVGIILQIVLMDLSTPQTPAHICFPNWLSGLFWGQKCTWVCTKYQRQLHNVEKKIARIFSFPLTYVTTIGWLKLLSSSTLSSKKSLQFIFFQFANVFEALHPKYCIGINDDSFILDISSQNEAACHYAWSKSLTHNIKIWPKQGSKLVRSVGDFAFSQVQLENKNS